MRTRLIVLLLIVIAALVGYGLYARGTSKRSLTWSGTVEAWTIDVGSRVGGRIQAVLADEGDRVRAGQALIVLEAHELDALRLQAEGQLKQAEAALEKVSASRGVPSARRQQITAARARLDAQKVALEKSRIDLERSRQLFSSGATSQAALDNANIAFKNADAERAAYRAELEQLVQATPQDVKAAEGTRDVAVGHMQQIDKQIEELTIRAPADARVEALDLRPGDILAPNATAARLLEPGRLFVRVYVPETQLGHIRPGLSVPVTVDSFPKRAFAGVVEYVSHQGEYTPRNLQTADERANQVFAARVRINDASDVLRPGMAAYVRIHP
ncbi:MAG: efflux RND transporter periplasmic adaptor subunit [Myxococcales bacterium]|nr:efflux RND transporter periplasmic adaptor subunit [Myxococcales bacterium]MCB9708206.1 efflux RND transporter periplasmic adaptor subunit [Myxococcales bacterium]